MYILKTFSNFPNLKELLLLGERQFSTVLHFGFQVNDSVYFTSFNKLFNKDSAITKMNSNLLAISIQAAFSLVNAFFGCICNVLCLSATLVCPSTAPFTMYLCNMEHDSLFPIYVSLLNMTVHFVDNKTKKNVCGVWKINWVLVWLIEQLQLWDSPVGIQTLTAPSVGAWLTLKLWGKSQFADIYTLAIILYGVYIHI